MKEPRKKLAEIFEAVDRIEESSEGLLLGGFAVIGEGDGGISPLYNENCNCNCSCEENGNCDCNCGCTINHNCNNKCAPTTKAVSGGSNSLGFAFSF